MEGCSLTNEEIVAEIRNGHSVTKNMEKLYKSNLPLIRRFIKPFAAYGELEDLLQESYFGLMQAVEHFETSAEVKFSTYMRYWIVQSAQRYLENCGIIRFPAHIHQKMSLLRKAAEQIRQQGREPTISDLASLTGIPEKECENLKAYAQGVSSLDAPLTEDEGLTLADTLQADSSPENEVVEEIYAEHSKSELWGIVERYTAARENAVIREYFINNKPVSQIARKSGLSIDRIRQIKEKGLRKLQRGKARRRLLEKFDIIDSKLYRGGLSNYVENCSSIVEYLSVRKIEAEERYQRHLEEIEAAHRKRLSG